MLHFWGYSTHFNSLLFVPKGEDGIRLVYNLTASGLNDALWVPTLWIPLLYNVLDVATRSSWFGDIYAAEMFRNYNIPESLQQYAGFDVYWAEKGNLLR